LGGRELSEVPKAAYDYDVNLPGAEANWWLVEAVKKFILSRNNIRVLPEGLGILATLTHLDVSHNQLSDLPHGLTNLKELKLLNIDSNEISGYLTDAVAYLPSLVVLNCSSNNLQRLPEGLGSAQRQLAVLECRNNQIEALPMGLSVCSSITKLDAEKNRISMIPPQILMGGLSIHLINLNLSKNLLTSLPDEMGMLDQLQSLNLQQNLLTSLPWSIGYLTSLVELQLGHNQLTSIPNDISKCTALLTLDIRNNKLEALPEGLCDLKLHLIDAQNNNLKNLPPRLGLMTSLRTITLEGNGMRTIRRELIEGPISHLLAYLVTRLPDDQRPKIVPAV
jgi:Leucine-rich repeat (LRR) protein